MLITLKLSDFSSTIGSLFQLHTEPDILLQLELLEVVKLGDRPANAGDRPESFSLLFKGPSDMALPQRIYHLNHSQLGELDIFLVPVARRADGMCYEAIFN